MMLLGISTGHRMGRFGGSIFDPPSPGYVVRSWFCLVMMET